MKSVNTRVGAGPMSDASTKLDAQPRIKNLHEAVDYLGLSYWTIRDLIHAGIIPTVKIPSARAGDGRAIRRILIDKCDLDAFINGNKERQD
jgi:hypothetical protein